MPISILNATLLSHTEDHASGVIVARVAYAFNTGAVEEKTHAGIPISAVDAAAAADGRTARTAADVCAVVKQALGANADDLDFVVAVPPTPKPNT